jgi:hypothetical protein
MARISQEKLTSFCWRTALVFFFLYATTLTFEYYLFDGWFRFIDPPLRWLAEETGMLFFSVNLVGAEAFYSDSLIVFVHLFNLALIAVLAAAVWTFCAKRKFTETKFYPFLFTLLRYFVALNLFVYGFSKIYKWQFMLPEPNLLYTTVGEMHRDILYWTSMGSSRSYSVFMGVAEVIPAVLLLFRRTTLLGAFAAVLVMTNVVAVNFGFDITVKLHSLTLLLMSLVLLIPGRKRIVALFTGKAAEAWNYPVLVFPWKQKWIAPVLKIAVILLLVSEAHYPYTKTGIYNDDVSARPPMHGAYEVLDLNKVQIDSGMVFGYFHREEVIRRIFIHRRGYIIFQYADGSIADHTMSIDSAQHIIRFDEGGYSSQFTYAQRNDSIYEFRDEVSRRYYTVKKLKWEKLPLMEDEFTWIDKD